LLLLTNTNLAGPAQ